MRISFSKLNSDTIIPEMDKRLLVFRSPGPTILQPGEIKKIKTGLNVTVEAGYVLQIISWPDLHEKAICVFPGPLVIDSFHTGELFIPLQNSGRAQVNLLPKDVIARGVVIKTEEVEIIELTPTPTKTQPPKNIPSKKNADIRFEIK